MKIKNKFHTLILLFTITMISAVVLIPNSEHKKYFRSDFYNYYILTEPEIRNAPRISENYYFYYTPPDGGQTETSTITFIGGDSRILKKYLTELGFYLDAVQDNGHDEIWMKHGKSRAVFNLHHNNKTRIISLTKTIIPSP